MKMRGHLITDTVIILTLIVFVASVDGTRPGLDTDSSDASATFIGDDANDWFGHSLASVGDVNGDGFDDMLVGAPNNGDGGVYSGQTYLILGKSTGWVKKTKPEKMDASFIGENPNDISGSSVAGAGDVNGDGLNDILVGAWRSDDGGTDAGLAYLILGRSTGWLA